MARNLAIDPGLLERALEVSGERTKKAAVTRALQEFIARRERARIIEMFAALECHSLSCEDHVAAAGVRNTLRSAGVQVGTIDALIAHLATADGHTLLTTDNDFRATASHISLQLWV
ncbi:MAG: type II toxin-antitoxin system VapB family antitoxin [Streptosporangiaceae bacterium]